jgi:hypothetical protein
MIKKLENVITTVFNRHLLEISFTFIQDLVNMLRVYPLGILGIRQCVRHQMVSQS